MKAKVILKNTEETAEEIRNRMSEELGREMEKLHRDMKCGGVRGNHYVALNYRVRY